MKGTFKDIATNIVAILLLLVEPINTWLISDAPFNWKTFASTVLMAIVAYYTGKGGDGKAKVV